MKHLTSAAIFAGSMIAFGSLALADEDEPSWEDSVVNQVGRKESKLQVVPADQAKKMKTEPGPSDEPVHVYLPSAGGSHRDDGLPYMDPFFGHAIYPQLSGRLLTGFVTERFANKGEANAPPSRMAIA